MDIKINLVKVISTAVDDLKRRLVKVQRLGVNDIQTPFEATPFGQDSNCPKGFVAVYATTQERGKNVIIGYLNKNSLAKVGENRLYSTNEAGDEEKMYLLLTNDGFMELGGNTNWAVKYTELKTELDKLKQDFNNLVSTFNSHTQAVIVTPSGPVASAPTVPATPNTSDFSLAKNDKIKTIG